jgi:hypothetical protein
MMDYLYRPTRFWHASWCVLVLLLQPMAPALQSQERVNQNAHAVANKALPPLPDELEYRLVGDTLILFDAHAPIVVDLFQNVLPKR